VIRWEDPSGGGEDYTESSNQHPHLPPMLEGYELLLALVLYITDTSYG